MDPKTFAELGLSPNVQAALDAAGYTSPTPIQASAIPVAVAGRDVLGIAQTGTGKTAAFVLPMITRLETGRARLANLEKARENYELLQAEIENLETKIQSITELAINRGDAEAMTGQVEQITQGLVRTEQTINDLGFATGVEQFDLTVPRILPREPVRETQVEQEAPPPYRQREDEIRFQ